MNGRIHVYTGNGKGKTTAAFGLALRAIGAGKKVFIAQFVKNQKYSEVVFADNHLPNINIKQYGMGCFIINTPTSEDIDIARAGLSEVEQIILSDKYDLVILDEANIAIYYNLFSAEELIEVIKRRPNRLEIVVTGRYAKAELIDVADLVTEMQEIKHYYQQGLESREGIEY